MGDRFAWPAGIRAAVTFKFDDARTSQIDHGLAVLDRFGVRATFFVTPAGVRQRPAGWRRAVRMGHEIAAHTVTHPCSGRYTWSRRNPIEGFTVARFEREEILPANRFLRRTLGVTPRTFSYPCGHQFVGRGASRRSYVPMLTRHYRSAVNGVEHAMNPRRCDLMRLAAAGCDEASFAGMKRLSDRAIADGAWIIFGGHDIAPRRAGQTTHSGELANILRYLTRGQPGLWVGTVSEIADWIRLHRPVLRTARR